MRYAARRDESEAAIIEALTDAGYYVGQVSSAGIPDLLVGRFGCPLLLVMECKTATGKLTAPQREFWLDLGAVPVVVRSAQEALETVAEWFKEKPEAMR